MDWPGTGHHNTKEADLRSVVLRTRLGTRDQSCLVIDQMCCAVASIPSPEQVTPDTPLRLEIATTIAFPDGSMTAAGLLLEEPMRACGPSAAPLGATGGCP
jgi:hypothetical protein